MTRRLIDFLCPREEPEPIEVIPCGFREMTAQEITDHLETYCEKCAQEIQTFLLDIYNTAMRDGVQPEYFRGLNIT